ncbi:hypothetical protein ACH4VR_36315 [Streptomyces sp. NPDC020883]|uniref:hypothetical protein n=1 Tax=Streptomyces sp. NPDC020883 TaxID=3365099 RepID=UPI0037AA1680
MAQQRSSHGRWKITMLAIALLASLGVTIAVISFVVHSDRPYPTEDPTATLRRLNRHTRAAHDALGIPNTQLSTTTHGQGVSVDPTCPRPGFLNGLRDSPDLEEHVVRIGESWMLANVKPGEAWSAAQRMRDTLKKSGWRVTFSAEGLNFFLTMQPPGANDSVSVSPYPGDRLEISAHSQCARYPDATPTGLSGEPELPRPTPPTQEH